MPNTTPHRKTEQAEAHSALRYIAADVTARGSAESGGFAGDDPGVLGYVTDTGALRYLATPSSGTWATIYPGHTVSSSAPTANNDIDSGYEEGHFWIHTTGPTIYMLADSSSGAADWDQINGGGGGGGTVHAASSDNRIARYDGTDQIQGSGITINDSDDLSGVHNLSVSDTDVDTGAAVSITRSPGSSAAAVGMSITMGANASGPGLSIVNNGSGPSIDSGATDLTLATGGTNALTLDSSQDATFAGAVKTTNGATGDAAVGPSGDLDTGLVFATGVVSIYTAGILRAALSASGLNVNVAGSKTNPAVKMAGDQLGMYRVANDHGGLAANGDAVEWDNDSTAGNTRLLVYDEDSGAVGRVKVGSNGTGPGGTGRALYMDNV